MSSELSPSSGEFSFVFGGLVRSMALARMMDSSANRSSVVSVSAGGAKAMSLGMGSEPPEVVCSVISGWVAEFQYNSDTCRKTSKSFKAKRRRRPTHCPLNIVCKQGPPSHTAPRKSADQARRWLLSIWPRRGADPRCCVS